MPDLATVVANLNLLNRERLAFIKARVKLENMARSRIQSMLGFNPREKGSKASDEITSRSNKILSAIQKAKTIKNGKRIYALKDIDLAIAREAADFVEPVLLPLPLLKAGEKARTDDMERLASQLPPDVVRWQKSVNGFGLRGLAVVTAICHGDNMQGLADFATNAKVWRRMGLNAQPSVQERETFKAMRTQAYAFIYDPVIRAQVRKEPEQKDYDTDEDFAEAHAKWVEMGGVPDEGSIATGPYGAIYLRAKTKYLPRVAATKDLASDDPAKWPGSRAELAARRYMAKRLLRDLWRAWRSEAVSRLAQEPRQDVPPPPQPSPAGDQMVPAVTDRHIPNVAAPEKPKRGRKSARGKAKSSVAEKPNPTLSSRKNSEMRP